MMKVLQQKRVLGGREVTRIKIIIMDCLLEKKGRITVAGII